MEGDDSKRLIAMEKARLALEENRWKPDQGHDEPVERFVITMTGTISQAQRCALNIQGVTGIKPHLRRTKSG